ncbi:zinc finger MYM-type protein 1-like [Hydra vulgaris]|uniref:Zinc finger MYM-type protein 1-like n=1 Tax=Hydra vulgaris TaxID=6087 RepID=A0ABM4DHJ8_HYDVU
MKCTYPSGASKLKISKVKKAALQKGRQTLFDVGITTTPKTSDALYTSSTKQKYDGSIQSSVSGNSAGSIEKLATFEDCQISGSDNTSTRTTSSDGPALLQPFDIGEFETENFSPSQLEKFVMAGHIPFPLDMPKDNGNRIFSMSVLKSRMPKGNPSRGIGLNQLPHMTSSLATIGGWGYEKKWKNLISRIPEHEHSKIHKQCYIQWRELEARMKTDQSIEHLMNRQILNEADTWRKILERILDVILFLGERGLAIRGKSDLIGDSHNVNFLGLLELISHYDPILKEHVIKVKQSQDKGQRLQAHYLSNRSQNKFIGLCAAEVRRQIIEECKSAKYFSIMVDATPDVSHTEQSSFVIRYVHEKEPGKFLIEERFLIFADCAKKTGSDIAELILETLETLKICFEDCRGQGYDNGVNMSGKYKGVQAILQKKNPLSVFSPCGCHSLNLCGQNAASSCTDAETFFGTVQTVYTIFSASPQRWEILQKRLHGVSFHGQSGTRWTERLDSIRPFYNPLSQIIESLKEVKSLNLTPKAKTEIRGALKYMSSFKCVLMSGVWLKVLTLIDRCNQVIQARKATIDIEVENIEALISQLKSVREEWPTVLEEPKLVADVAKISSEFPIHRKVKRKSDEQFTELTESESGEEATFRRTVFYHFFDSVIGGLTARFTAIQEILSIFSFLWKYQKLSEAEIKSACSHFSQKYSCDVTENELTEELLHIKQIHTANFGKDPLAPFDLLNKISEMKLGELFRNIVIALRIFASIPVTVASKERSFSKLKLIKNFLRSTMGQERTSDLAILSIECLLAKNIDFHDVIEKFAKQKTRKIIL